MFPGRNITSCVTCNPVFLRADITIELSPGHQGSEKVFEAEIFFYKSGLYDSVRQGCRWCATLLHHYINAYSDIKDPECTFEQTMWYVKLAWSCAAPHGWQTVEPREWRLVRYEPCMEVGSRVLSFDMSLSLATGNHHSLSQTHYTLYEYYTFMQCVQTTMF